MGKLEDGVCGAYDRLAGIVIVYLFDCEAGWILIMLQNRLVGILPLRMQLVRSGLIVVVVVDARGLW